MNEKGSVSTEILVALIVILLTIFIIHIITYYYGF